MKISGIDPGDCKDFDFVPDSTKQQTAQSPGSPQAQCCGVVHDAIETIHHVEFIRRHVEPCMLQKNSTRTIEVWSSGTPGLQTYEFRLGFYEDN